MATITLHDIKNLLTIKDFNNLLLAYYTEDDEYISQKLDEGEEDNQYEDYKSFWNVILYNHQIDRDNFPWEELEELSKALGTKLSEEYLIDLPKQDPEFFKYEGPGTYYVGLHSLACTKSTEIYTKPYDEENEDTWDYDIPEGSIVEIKEIKIEGNRTPFDDIIEIKILKLGEPENYFIGDFKVAKDINVPYYSDIESSFNSGNIKLISKQTAL